MNDADSAAFVRRLEPFGSAESPTLDGIAAIERQLQERLARLSTGTREFPDAPGRLHFWVGGQQYSTALSGLRQALTSLPAISQLPCSPPWLVGLFPLRTHFVALLDLHMFLRSSLAHVEETDTAPRYIEQALLVGDDGRLLAFAVDRIGKIGSHGEPRASMSEERDRGGPEARYVEGYFPPDTPGASDIVALNLAQLHEDVIARLEEWSHHV